MTPEDLLRLARAMRAAGASTDAVLAALRVEGASQAISVRVLRDLEGVRLGEAKELLDRSPVWADTRSLNESIRRAAVDALDMGSDA